MNIKIARIKSLRKQWFFVLLIVVSLIASFSNSLRVQAAACSSSNVTFSRLSSDAFYIDSGFLYRYIGYSITTSSSKSYSDLWVTIDSFSTTSGTVLSADSVVEDGSYHVGALGTSSTAYVYFYVKASTNASNTNAQNYNLNLFNNKPSGSNLAECNSAQSTPTIESDAFANANKVTSVTYTAPYLGSSFTMTVTGDTGVIGAGKIFSYSPASDNTWNADCLELRDTSIVLSGGNTGTYNHLLVLTSAQLTNTATTHYVATYTFDAKCVTSTSTAVKPLNYISSGGSPRHTDNSSFASLPPIAPAVNSLIMTNSVSPAASTSGGTTTYSVDITNSGPSSASLDDIIDTLPSSPANASYVNNSATFDDDVSGGASASSISNPSISGQILTWTRTFAIPSSKTGRLTFQATIPSTVGSYVNSVIGHSGTSQIDQTIDTTNNSPATSTYGVGSINMAASTKTASDVNGGSLQPGDVIEYTITANNSGTSDATGVHISDTLDANTNNLTAVVIGANATDCGITYSNNSTSTVLDITGVKVTHGTSCIITFRATVKSSAAAGATILNTASIVPSNDGAINGNPSSTPMVVRKDPILSITNTENDADNIVTANQVISYTITITNSGQGDANGVDLSGTITGPTGGVSSRTLTNCGPSSTYVDTSSGQTLAIAALSIATSNPCVISYTVTVNSGASSGSVTNSVDITAAREGGNDPSPVSASTLLIGVVATPPSLSVAVNEDDADDFVTPGQTVVYTIVITNSGQTDATTSLTSSIPSGMGTPGTRSYSNCGSPGSSFSAGTLTITSISVAASNTCTITFSEVVNSPQNEGSTLTLGADVAAASQGGNNPSNVNATTLTVDATPVLSLTFTENDADNNVSRDQDVTYTATITNSGDGAATVVLFADSPTGAISSPSNFSFTNCGSSYSNNSTSSVSIEGLTIQVGTPCVVSYHVTVNGDAEADSTITNSGDISAASEGGNNPIPVSASNLTVASNPPNLTVTNVDNDADNNVTPGQDITYTVTITNDGGKTGTNISLNDPVSGAVGNVNSFNFSNCGSSYTNNSSAATVSITGLAVTTGSPCVITFHVSVNSNAAGGSSISSSADASAATEGGNNPSAVASDSLSVTTIPDLFVSVDSNDFDNVVTPGQVVTFSVTINNSGNGTAHTSGTVTIPNKVSSPSNVSFSHCGSAANSYSNPTLTLSSLTITTSNDCVISFTVTVNSPSTEGATFVVSSDIAAANEGGNNPDSVDSSVHTINVTPNLSTSTFAQSDANGSTLKPGETVNYTITIKNTGDGTASGVSLTNSTPSNVNFDPNSIVFTNCGNTITDNSVSGGLDIVGLQVAVGTNCVVIFSGTVRSPLDEGTAISNTANISAASEGGSGATPSTGSLNIDATPNLSVSITDDDSDNVVTPEQTVHYSLTISNSGDGSASTSTLVTIPSGMETPTNITYDHCNSPSNSYSGHTLTLSNLKISTTNDCLVDFDVSVSSPSTENMELIVSADVAAASEGGNNPAAVAAETLTVNVTPQLNVSITDDDTDNTVNLGEVVNMTITIANSGDGTATGISMSYSGSLPASHLGNIQLNNCGNSYDQSHTGHTLNLTGLEVAVGSNCIITFSYSVDPDANDGAQITNAVDASAASEGGNDPSLVVGDTLTVDTSNTAPNTPTNVSSAIFGSHNWLKSGGLSGATLISTISDPNSSDQVRYQVQLSLDSGFFTYIAVDYSSTLGTQGARTYTYQEDNGTYSIGSASTVLSDGAYYMRIRAVDEKDSTSGWYTVPGIAFNYDTTAPSKPAAPYLISKDVGKATIGWGANNDANPHPLLPYRIEHSASANFNTYSALDTNDLSALFSSLPTNARRYFRVYFRDAAGNFSSPSDVLSVLIPAKPSPPSKPTTTKEPTAGNTSTQNNSGRSANNSGSANYKSTPPRDNTSNIAEKDTIKVTILVRDSNGIPIQGAKVTLYSKPRTAYTDQNGLVTFDKVPIGEHTAVVEYDDKKTSTPVTLSKGVKELKVTLTLENVNKKVRSWCWLWYLLLIPLIYVGWRYYRHRRKKVKSYK